MKVSVFCTAYNHEKYIRKALEGFVMQKTNFEFEVLIHDDASTDNTASIIREFEQKYPDIIKAVYQQENQFSKGVKINRNILLPKAEGEYIAICEGDDYWTDELKLQKQYDFLSKNPDYAICVHNSVLKYDDKSGYCTHKFEDCDYTTDEIIRFGGNIFATNSIMMKKDVYISTPSVFFAKGFGDYQTFIYASICGKVRYLSDVMSVYNYATVGSWTERVWNNEQKRIEHYNQLINLLENIDEYYKGEYSEPITYKVNETKFHILLLEKNYKKAKKEPYKLYWKKMRKGKVLRILKKFLKFLVPLKNFVRKRSV